MRRVPEPPEAVVFDCDGLLLDTESAWTRAEATQYAGRGVRFTLEHKRDLIGASGPRAEAALERHLSAPGEGAALMAELHVLVHDEVARAAPPQPGALELLDALRTARIPVGLASNSPRPIVELALRTTGLDMAFASVLTADDVAQPKPAPDVYLASCAALGASPERSVALEDSPTGVAAAVAAGMFVFGVPSLEGIVLSEAHRVERSLHDIVLGRREAA